MNAIPTCANCDRPADEHTNEMWASCWEQWQKIMTCQGTFTDEEGNVIE